MFAHVELAQDFTNLNEHYRKLVQALLDVVGMPSVPLEIGVNREGNFRGFDANLFYMVDEGSISARYQGKTVYILEAGELLLPDIAGSWDSDTSVFFGSDVGARLRGYPALDFMGRVLEEPSTARLWTRMLVTYSGLMLRISAANCPEDASANLVFETHGPGEIIIRQGDRASHVYNMFSGVAEVLVDDVTVGRIADGEIFGAMAALTQTNRSATVRAKTTCSMVKVPKDQFTELIRTDPTTIHGLLIDMANSIANLNEQLVGLRGNHSVD